MAIRGICFWRFNCAGRATVIVVYTRRNVRTYNNMYLSYNIITSISVYNIIFYIYTLFPPCRYIGYTFSVRVCRRGRSKYNIFTKWQIINIKSEAVQADSVRSRLINTMCPWKIVSSSISRWEKRPKWKRPPKIAQDA